MFLGMKAALSLKSLGFQKAGGWGGVKLVTKGRESRPSLQTTFTFLIEPAHMIPIIFPSSLRAAGHGVG